MLFSSEDVLNESIQNGIINYDFCKLTLVEYDFPPDHFFQII
jgi:hypothetical protein